MADNLRTLFRLYRLYARMDFLWFLRDTKYCLLQISADVVTVFSTVAGMLLLSAKFGGLGGMDENEILFMLGYAVTVEGLYMFFFVSNNIWQISRVIGRGQLDHCMIQPVPLWIQLATQGFAPFSGSGPLLCGLFLLARAAGGLGLAWTPGTVLILAGSVLCSSTVLLSCVFWVSCTAFYAPAAAEEIAGEALSVFSSTKSYPLGGVSPSWQIFLCTVMPIGLTAWLPSFGLLRRGDGGYAALAMTAVAASCFLTVMTLTFRKGLEYYARQGCSRYSGFGHR